MRVLVFGGRYYKNRRRVNDVLSSLNITTFICGGAPGADSLAADWAYRHLDPSRIHVVMADWDRYGLAAGPKRNQQMLDEYSPEFGVGFPGGRGTADMLRRLRRAGVPVLVIENDK